MDNIQNGRGRVQVHSAPALLLYILGDNPRGMKLELPASPEGWGWRSGSQYWNYTEFQENKEGYVSYTLMS